MARRDDHYEAAFEEYLRWRGVPYVAVDESRRSLLAEGESLKSLDFIVSSSGGTSWLVDVKGRRFPSGSAGKQYWKNWSTHDDLESLTRWEAIFGAGFRGLLVFAYNIVGDRAPLAKEQLFEHRGALYAFLGLPLCDYVAHCRRISIRWDTVSMPAADFRRLAKHVDEFLLGESPTAAVRSPAAEPSGPQA